MSGIAKSLRALRVIGLLVVAAVALVAQPTTSLAAADTATTIEAETLVPLNGGIRVVGDSSATNGQAMGFWKNGSAERTVSTPAASQLTVRARGEQCGGAPRLTVKVDGRVALRTTVTSTSWSDYRTNLALMPGQHTIRVSFTNDRYRKGRCDRNLFVDRLTLSTTAPSPAPVATPTATATATPRATATPTPTATPQATPRATATPTSVPVASPSPQSTPVAPVLVIADPSAAGGQAIRYAQNATATKQTTTPAVNKITVTARGEQCSGAPVMSVKVDGTEVFNGSVATTTWTGYSAPVSLSSGSHMVAISFTNQGATTGCSRALLIDKVAFTPTPAPAPSPTATPSSTPTAAVAACTTTLSPGANVVAAIASATSGSTICLNGGNYDGVTVSSIAKASDVTIRSVVGTEATISLSLTNGTNHLRFQNLTISGLDIRHQTKNITFTANTFTGQTLIDMGGNGGNYGSANILIDRNTINPISVCANCYEGRIQILSNLPSGVTISNNHFIGPGESDGIQNGANGVSITGNLFEGIVQAGYGRHVDTIQLYGASHTTISGNLFRNGSSYIMAPDGGDHEIVTNNVFIHGDYDPAIQFGSHLATVFSHNTIIGNLVVNMSRKYESTQDSANGVIQNNIFAGGRINTIVGNGPLPRPSGCVGCTISYNMFTAAGDVSGSNVIIGSPVFAGGSSPANWAGFMLVSSSPGYKAASDGTNLGI